MIDLATTLTADLGHPVQANAYITPPSSRGFSAHYDVHDVFVLQTAGRKRWQVWAPVLDAPLRDQPWARHAEAVAARAITPPLLDVELQPGDCLYLPRGYLHAAEALGEVSAHLTLGVHPVTRWDVVELVVAALAEDPALRLSLPAGLDLGDDAALEPLIAETIEAMVRRLATTEASSVVPRLAARVLPRTRPSPLSPLATASALPSLTVRTAVRRRGGLLLRQELAGDSVRLTLPDRTLTLPGSLAEGLTVLLDGGRHELADAGLEADDAVVLGRRLLVEGVLVLDVDVRTRR